ncbi:MAG: carboxypeptidase-like regulatory domain-containing protein [Prevotella sp.]|nr:carboxypeptidase-like regulatory domain-containing protein [Prevotella sp.]
MDLTARKQQRLDLNGKPCAMLKIMVMDDITDCNKSNIGDIATSGVMKLVYLPSVVRSVTLNFKYHYPLTITFADYGVTKLEGSATYELRLVDALQMMMENGNAAQQTATATTTTIPNVGNSQNANTAQQTAPVTTTQNVSSSQNNSLSMSAKEASKIADEAYNAKDYAKALKYYQYAAEKNDNHAQFSLGCMYYEGKGVTQDYAEAFKWYLKASKQGDTYTQYLIGDMYYEGKGVTQDYAEAFKWNLKAAEKGWPDAQNSVGLMYERGQGVKQDYSEALKWYTKASERGNWERGNKYALYNLGLMYAKGTGMKSKNIAKALECFNLAALKGHKGSKEKLDEYRKNGNIIGVVIDYVTKEPIIGCSVIVVKSDKTSSKVGTVSDINGIFSINANVGDEIKVQYKGYTKRRVKILNDNPMIVYMFK